MLWEVVEVEVIGVVLPREEVNPYLTIDEASSSVVQVMVAVFSVTVELGLEIVGAMVSGA